MLASRLARTAAARSHPRLFHVSALARAGGHDPQVSQGHASLQPNHAVKDPHSQSVHGGKEAGDSSNPMDAASGAGRTESGGTKGNPANVGMHDQVGAQSADSRGGEIGGSEEAAAPGVFGTIKQALGMANTDDVKQNQGGGRGVTGTGTARKFHTSAYAAAATRGQAPEGSRQPHESTHGDQNAHLHHKSSSGAKDTGKGNAAANPKLPSESVPQTKDNAPPSPHNPQARGIHTSAVRRAPVGNPSADPEQMAGGDSGEGEHSADSYFKEVDDAPSSAGSRHQVDSSSDALDVPQSGPYKEAGVGDSEYHNVSKDAPYTEPSNGKEGEKLRYGGSDTFGEDKGSSTSKRGEGPEAGSAGGRK